MAETLAARVAHIELDVGSVLTLRTVDGTLVHVRVVAKSGRRVRLRVDAPDSVSLKLPTRNAEPEKLG